MFVNIYQVVTIVLVVLVLISIVFATFVLFKDNSLEKFYPIVILVFALSMLLSYSLYSGYVHGPDAPAEFPLVRYTIASQFWNPTLSGRLYPMLSLTILPTVYSGMLNMDPTWYYKIVPPLIFAIVPLILYVTWQSYIGKKYAFIASFLLIAEPTFSTEMLALSRQMIAELFFALLIFILLKQNMRKLDRLFCFTLFSFGLIVSHYALAEIFLFVIAATSLTLLILSNFHKTERSNISLSMVLLFFAIMFFWYIYTSDASVFNSFVSFGQNVYNQLGDFANPASRGQAVLTGIGLISPPTIWNTISRGFAYIIEGLIVVGFVGLFSKRLKIKLNTTFVFFSALGLLIIFLTILVPGLAGTLNESRFFHILLFFVAPLCVLGAEFIGIFIFKQRRFLTLVMLTVLLVAYFLFQAGFIYQLVGNQNDSLPLSGINSGARQFYFFGIITAGDVSGAQWINHWRNVNTIVYAGDTTPLVEYGSGTTNQSYIWALTNMSALSYGDYVYLDTMNTQYNVVISSYVWNTSSLQQTVFQNADQIYSNGESQIYQSTSP